MKITTRASPRTRRVARYVVSSLFLTSTLARSSSRIQNRLALDSALHTRGGFTEEDGESSAGDIDDEELDEYIEFLLQAADRKVTERENPLYKRLQNLVGDATESVSVGESSGEADDGRQTRISSQADIVEPIQDADGTADPPLKENRMVQESDSIDLGTLEMLYEESISARHEDVLVETGSPVDESNMSDEPSKEPTKDFIDKELQPVEGIQDTPFHEGADNSGLLEEMDYVQDPEFVPSVVVEVSAIKDGLPEQMSDSTLVDAVKALESTDVAASETILGEEATENASVQENLQVDNVFVSGDRGVSEVGTVEKSIQTDYDLERTEKLATEFFLGPSAVGESPAILEEQVTMAVDEGRSVDEVHDTIGITSEEAPAGEPGILGDAMRKWGSWTARLVGVRHVDEFESKKAGNQDEIQPKLLETALTESPSIKNPSDLEESTSSPASNELRSFDSPSVNETVLVGSEASTTQVKSSFLNNTMSSWGRLTAGVMGIKDEKNISKPLFRTHKYTRTWGRWTASLMGIDPASKIRRRPKKNYDRIYEKYFADFEYHAQDFLASKTSDAGAVDLVAEGDDISQRTLLETVTEPTPETVSVSSTCGIEAAESLVEVCVEQAAEKDEEDDLETTTSLDISLGGEMPVVVEKTTPNVVDHTPVDALADISTGADSEVGDDEVSRAESLYERTDVHHMLNDDLFDDDLRAKTSMDSFRDDDGRVEIGDKILFDEPSDVEGSDTDTENEVGRYSVVSEPVQVARVVDPMVVMEAETLNFFYAFLVARGLDVWLMVIVLLVEWARVYLSPFTDILIWALSSTLKSLGRPSLEEKLMTRIRGGSVELQGEDDTRQASGGDDEEEEDALPTSIESEERATDKALDMHPVPVIRTRPNRLYQHLFAYGQVGHFLIMTCVLLQEWVDTYLPVVGNSFRRVVAESFPSLLGPRELSDAPISQTTGFVGADGTAVRGAKKRKSQLRKDDQKALYQLSRVGNVATAKYRFVSQVFVKRHGIGTFSSESENSIVEPNHPRARSKQKNSHSIQSDDVESDSEWIVSALTKTDDTDSSVAVGASSPFTDGCPTIEIGVQIGTRKRPKRKRPAITDVAKITERSEHLESRKNNGPRVSDRESGVMGRIRAAGANSLVGRSILGAYPGDVPSPNEAGNPHGLFDLAERYGYGEWSDTEDETAPVDERGKQRENVRSRDKKGSGVPQSLGRRRKRSSQTVGLEFEFGEAKTTRSRSTVFQPATTPRQSTSSPAKVASVRQAGLDAIAERASKRRKQVIKSSSESKNSGNSPITRSQIADTSTVAGAGLQQLKAKLEASHEKEDSK